VPSEGHKALTANATYSLNSHAAIGLRGFTGRQGVWAITGQYVHPISSKLDAVLDLAVPFCGHTSISANTGDEVRQLLFTAKVVRQVNSTTSIVAGLSNQLGDSTRFALAGPVGDQISLVVGARVKF
jgi:hypothetical protein